MEGRSHVKQVKRVPSEQGAFLAGGVPSPGPWQAHVAPRGLALARAGVLAPWPSANTADGAPPPPAGVRTFYQHHTG